MQSERILIFLFLSFLLALGCKDAIQKNDKASDSISMSQFCLDKMDKSKAITSILATEEFQKYLHPKAEGRLPVQLLQSRLITEDLKLYSNGLLVQVVDSMTELVHRIRIDTSRCKDRILEFSIYYPIESSALQGFTKKEHGDWKATVTGEGEVD